MMTELIQQAVPVRQVAIVGGTHGNELIGVYLVKLFEQSPELIQRTSFQSRILLANPEAVTRGRRYVEQDLNRCFGLDDLNRAPATYEARQAQAIYQFLKPDGQQPVDLILDLHSTTANMGLTLILASYHPFNLRLAAYLSSLNPSVKIYCWPQAASSPFLRSICALGCAIEVGPVAQGVLNAALFHQTQTLIMQILDYIEACNQHQLPPSPDRITLYQAIETVDYPRDDQGEIQAMIYPQLQDRDYEPLEPDQPMFITFQGETIPYGGSSTVYPVFINEAAYYEKKIAMCLTQKQVIQIASP
ncbi:MAG: aspartoacylase [Elainella sp.]